MTAQDGRRSTADAASADTLRMTTRSFTFHIPEDMHEVLRQLAEKNERTVSGELRIAIRNHLENEEDDHGLCQERSEGKCFAIATHRSEGGPVCRRHAAYYTETEVL